MPEPLRPAHGWTIRPNNLGGYTMTRDQETVHLRWLPSRRRYRCSCKQPGCGHADILRSAQTTPTPPGWDDGVDDWPPG